MKLFRDNTTSWVPQKERAMTLLEIMVSLAILSIGLLGVLAAVPFGAYQMDRMVEKDFVTSTARNALGVLKSNHWMEPKNWAYQTWDFTLPLILDPLGDVNYPILPYDPTGEAAPERQIQSFSMGSGKRQTIWFDHPCLRSGSDPFHYFERLEPLFRSVDDIVYDREENSTKRPEILPDEEDGGRPAYLGEYSWMAMLTPMAVGTDSDYTNLFFPSEDDRSTVDVRADVVVFRGRVPGDPTDYITLPATLPGSGYAGGTFFFAPGPDTAPELLVSSMEQLKSSTHLLLVGPSDDGGQAFARWYRIAHYAQNFAGEISVTLIGDSTPLCWQGGGATVQMVIFKGVRGVASETTRLTPES